MNLESQVCSLEYAKRLKELGVKQESYFFWCDGDILSKKTNCNWYVTFKGEIEYETSGCGCCAHGDSISNLYSAFTASECGDLLPPSINEWGLAIDATSSTTQEGIKSFWHITYADYDKKLMNEISDLNLANAMAIMLIYLLENGYVKNA